MVAGLELTAHLEPFAREPGRPGWPECRIRTPDDGRSARAITRHDAIGGIGITRSPPPHKVDEVVSNKYYASCRSSRGLGWYCTEKALTANKFDTLNDAVGGAGVTDHRRPNECRSVGRHRIPCRAAVIPSGDRGHGRWRGAITRDVIPHAEHIL